ncbi:MAG: guanylate kinase [Christensenellales bacterium]
MSDVRSKARPPLLLVVSGPSGAGKGTVCGHLKKMMPELRVSVSATTRAPRPGEVEGMDYFFKSREEFLRMKQNDEFIETAELFGHYYGTPVDGVRQALSAGDDILLEIDIQGAMQVKRFFEGAVFVFVVPPTMEILIERIIGRATEDTESIRRRMAQARQEMDRISAYDYVIVNDIAEEAASRICCIMQAERFRVGRFRLVDKFWEVKPRKDFGGI